MKKFRFLIFMLMLTSIFIGCAQPTDDTVIPAKTTTEEDEDSKLSDEQKLYKAALLIDNDGSFVFCKQVSLDKRTFTIVFGEITTTEGYTIEVTENITVAMVAFNSALSHSSKEEIIISNIKQIYVEVK